uniref:Uncharacterized protein n=1 Tax=Saccharum officinarum TaxID=4547 RepID=A0A678THV2_SACOF|nr:hypothetical protein SO148P11_000007 [Saccharum officinarum]
MTEHSSILSFGWDCGIIATLYCCKYYNKDPQECPATLYCCKYYNKDPRECPGLDASAVAALIFTVLALIALSVALTICVDKQYTKRGKRGLDLAFKGTFFEAPRRGAAPNPLHNA